MTFTGQEKLQTFKVHERKAKTITSEIRMITATLSMISSNSHSASADVISHHRSQMQISAITKVLDKSSRRVVFQRIASERAILL